MRSYPAWRWVLEALGITVFYLNLRNLKENLSSNPPKIQPYLQSTLLHYVLPYLTFISLHLINQQYEKKDKQINKDGLERKWCSLENEVNDCKEWLSIPDSAPSLRFPRTHQRWGARGDKLTSNIFLDCQGLAHHSPSCVSSWIVMLVNEASLYLSSVYIHW